MSEGSAPTMDTAPPSATTQPSPINTSMTSAASNVFGTTELLELILLDVDMRTLLLSQRVSRDFNNTITSSPSLQEKLFFRAKRSIGTRREDPGKPEVNTLVLAQDVMESMDLEYLHAYGHRTSSDRFTLIVVVVFKPLHRVKQPKQKGREGSWRRTLVVQPVSGVGELWRLSYMREYGYARDAIAGISKWSDAVTMNELARTLVWRAEEGKKRPRSLVMQWEAQECLGQPEAED